MPRNFRFLDLQDLAVILPLGLDRSAIHLGDFSYFGIARLKAESNLAQATADVARMIPIALRSFSPPAGVSRDFLEKARIAPNLLPLKQDVVGNVSGLLWILMGGIGMVLLIACANVANLLLVRTEGRQHELALRAALGATRKRIALQLLVESSIIGLFGSIAGLGLAAAALRFLGAFAPSGLPRITDIGIDSRVLFFTLGITLREQFPRFGIFYLFRQNIFKLWAYRSSPVVISLGTMSTTRFRWRSFPKTSRANTGVDRPKRWANAFDSRRLMIGAKLSASSEMCTTT